MLSEALRQEVIRMNSRNVYDHFHVGSVKNSAVIKKTAEVFMGNYRDFDDLSFAGITVETTETSLQPSTKGTFVNVKKEVIVSLC